MKTILLCLVLLLSATLHYPQVTEEWVERYSGPGWLGASAQAIVVDGSGYVYVTGSSDGGQNSYFDYTTLKYNSDGIEIWEARYSTSNSFSHDAAVDLAVDKSGNVYVTGTISNGNNYDFCTVKYNSDGLEQWVRIYNGPGDGHEYAVALTIDAESNVYITGYSNGIGGVGTQYDYATIKYNANGDQLWAMRYDGPIGNNANFGDQPTAIAIDNGGNVYVTGFSEEDSLIFSFSYATVKYGSDGIEHWVKRYGHSSESYDNRATSITIDNDGNIYVTGRSDDIYTYVDFATIKYSSDGVEQWVQRYTGPDQDSYAEAVSIKTDVLGNIYVTGTASQQSGYEVFATVKYNSSGQEQWTAVYETQNSQGNFATEMAVDGLGGIYVTGQVISGSSNIDYVTVKYNSSGLQKWEIVYDGAGIGEDQVTDIDVSTSGDVYITGYSRGQNSVDEYATIKYSQSVMSTTLTSNAFSGSQVLEVASNNGFSIGDNIIINPGGATEETNTITGFGSLLLQAPLQFDHNGGETVELLISTSVEEIISDFIPEEFILEQNYPNPFNPTTKISWQSPIGSHQTIKVYDVLGNEIATLVDEYKHAGTYNIEFNASRFASGVYLYRLQANDFVATKKLLLIK